MVKKGNLKVGIVANLDDQVNLDYLCEKLGLKPTQIYRLALRYYARKIKEEG